MAPVRCGKPGPRERTNRVYIPLQPPQRKDTDLSAESPAKYRFTTNTHEVVGTKGLKVRPQGGSPVTWGWTRRAQRNKDFGGARTWREPRARWALGSSRRPGGCVQR